MFDYETLRVLWWALLGILLFFEEYGPTLLIWLAILALPVFLAWRRYRRLHSKT